jgi:hypothetical protein
MSNRIPTATGTLKERKERQAQSDADLALEIANSKRLARASRDYWVNGETPINTQGDYTTNEIINDKNKLLKILSNDVKSLLDKEQYTIFISDNAWNNIRYLRLAVQLFPTIKKEIGQNLRLVTANLLLQIINASVVNNGYAEEEQNQNPNDNPEEEDLYAGFDEPNNINGQNYAREYRRPDARAMDDDEFGGLPNLIPLEESNRDRIVNRVSDDNSSSADYFDMVRQRSGNTEVSGLSDREFSTLVPYVERPQGRRNEFNEGKLAEKIQQLSRLNREEIVPIISKLINISDNGQYINSQGAKNASTRRANVLVTREFERIPGSSEMDVAERLNYKDAIARDIAGRYITNLYTSGLYDFPEPTATGKQYEKMGYGVKGIPKKGTKYGKGMALQEMKGVSAPIKPVRSELYYSFGVFAVHKKSLGDNILNLKYKSFSQVHKFPKRQISADLRDILVDAIETKKINNKLFSALTDSDKHFLTELVSEAKLKDQFANIFKTKVGDGIAVNENPFDRFEILKGQLIAGNSNPEVKKELRLLVQKFMKDGLIEKRDGFGILELL